MQVDKFVLGGIITFTVLAIGLIAYISLKDPRVAPLSRDVLISESSHFRGKEGAEVVLVDFSDYQCPFCASFNTELKTLVNNYGDQVMFVHRHFPLVQIHSNARSAAEASEAAAKQSSFWEYNDALYEFQNDLGEDTYLEIAESIALDVDQFKTDLESDEVKGKVSEDLSLATNLNLSGTPSLFLINKDDVRKIDLATDDVESLIKEALGLPKDFEPDSTSKLDLTEEEFSKLDGIVEEIESNDNALKEVLKDTLVDVLVENDSKNLDELSVESVEKKDWNSSALGCPKEDYVYADVITPGYKFVVEYEGNIYNYHTDSGDNRINCEEDNPSV